MKEVIFFQEVIGFIPVILVWPAITMKSYVLNKMELLCNIFHCRNEKPNNLADAGLVQLVPLGLATLGPLTKGGAGHDEI